MNTPYPCYDCDNLYWNVLYEDDPSYMAECMLGLEMGDEECGELSTQQEVCSETTN